MCVLIGGEICAGVLDHSLSFILLNGNCETVCFGSFYGETYEELLSPWTPALFLRKSYINNGIRFTKYLSIPIPIKSFVLAMFFSYDFCAMIGRNKATSLTLPLKTES